MTERSERPTAPGLAQRERLPYPDFGQTAMQALAGSPPAVRRFIHAQGMRYLLSPHGSAVRKHRGNKLTTAERAFPSGRAKRTLARNENLAGIYVARQGMTCAAAVDPSVVSPMFYPPKGGW